MSGSQYWNRRMSRRSAITGALSTGTGLAALGLVGCGGGADDDETVVPGETPQPTPTADPTKVQEVQGLLWSREDTSARAVKGGIYQSYTTADVTNLDPLSSPSFTANSLGSWFYPRLLSYKPGYRIPATGEVQGYLAQSFELPEPTRVIFKLRPNAVWQDGAPLNKRPIDAEDVAFSWEKFAAKSISRKDLAKLSDNPNGPVESVKAIDKTTVEFRLAFPYAPLLSALAYSRYLQIMPRESESGGYDPRNEVRSGGPWILQNYQRNVKFEYRKNPDYWDADKVYLDGLDIPIIPEYAAGLAQFRAKKIWAHATRQEDIIATKKDLPELAVMANDFGRTVYMNYFGLQPGSPFLDPRVRAAASMLIDRDLWIDTFYNVTQFQKEGYPTDVRWHSHISSGWEGLWLDPRGSALGAGAKNFQHNIAEAKKLMEAAGFGSGIETDIAWIATGQYGTTFPKQAEVFKGMLEESGLFKLKQVNPDYQTDYVPNYYFGKGNFKGIAIAAITTYPEIDQFLVSYYHSTGARQKVAFNGESMDPELDTLIMNQRKELDANKRKTIIQDIQKRMADKMHVMPWPGQSPGFSLFWPWIGNAGVFRAWDTESSRDTVSTSVWFDKSKYTG